jgi:hypothetical protein
MSHIEFLKMKSESMIYYDEVFINDLNYRYVL